MPQELLTMLQPIGNTGYVIGGNDKPSTMTTIRWRWNRINDQINLHGATPHVFRHSFATLLNNAGADVKTIQAVIGDSDFKTVADRYCHPRTDRMREAVNAVQTLLSE